MKNLEKMNFVKTVFLGGAKQQLKQSWTVGAAASIGLYQGLKYNGSIARGIKGGVATLAVLAGANGFYNIMTYWDKMKEIFKKDAQ